MYFPPPFNILKPNMTSYEELKRNCPHMFTPVYMPTTMTETAFQVVPASMVETAYQVVPASMESSMYYSACETLDSPVISNEEHDPLEGIHPMECRFIGEPSFCTDNTGRTFEERVALYAAYLAKAEKTSS